LAYTPIFLVRRSFFILLTFAVIEQPSLQVHLFIYVLMWYVIYLQQNKPHETSYQLRVETINEVLFLVIIYHFVLYTDLVESRDMREMIGWSQIGFVILILAVNTYIVLSVTF
jgi:hypothetical protein